MAEKNKTRAANYKEKYAVRCYDKYLSGGGDCV
jgi:hypothetical protein